MNAVLEPDELLTIGEMGRRTGVAASALRYYEDLGLVGSVRTAGDQRRYPRHMLRRVSLISVAKRLGMPLSDVKEAFGEVPMDSTPSHADWQRASRRWRKRLKERRRAIERLEHELTGCIGCGCLSLKACALLNPDDALAMTGPGPQRLEDIPEDDEEASADELRGTSLTSNALEVLGSRHAPTKYSSWRSTHFTIPSTTTARWILRRGRAGTDLPATQDRLP